MNIISALTSKQIYHIIQFEYIYFWAINPVGEACHSKYVAGDGEPSMNSFQAEYMETPYKLKLRNQGGESSHHILRTSNE